MTPWENHVTPRFTILQSSTPDINNQMDFSIWIFCGSKNGQTKQEFHLSVPTFEQHTTCVDCKEISCNQHLLDDTPAWCQLPSLAYPGNPVYGAIVKPTKAVPQSVTPIWAPQDHHGFTDTGMGWSRSSATITSCCCCNWKRSYKPLVMVTVKAWPTNSRAVWRVFKWQYIRFVWLRYLWILYRFRAIWKPTMLWAMSLPYRYSLKGKIPGQTSSVQIYSLPSIQSNRASSHCKI